MRLFETYVTWILGIVAEKTVVSKLKKKKKRKVALSLSFLDIMFLQEDNNNIHVCSSLMFF